MHVHILLIWLPPCLPPEKNILKGELPVSKKKFQLMQIYLQRHNPTGYQCETEVSMEVKMRDQFTSQTTALLARQSILIALHQPTYQQ